MRRLFQQPVNHFEDVERFRLAADAGSIEFAVEIVFSGTAKVAVKRIGSHHGLTSSNVAKLGKGLTPLPTYMLGAPEAWPDSILQMWHDFMNAIGVDSAGSQFEVKEWTTPA